jgi:hypothetical protein
MRHLRRHSSGVHLDSEVSGEPCTSRLGEFGGGGATARSQSVVLLRSPGVSPPPLTHDVGGGTKVVLMARVPAPSGTPRGVADLALACGVPKASTSLTLRRRRGRATVAALEIAVEGEAEALVVARRILRIAPGLLRPAQQVCERRHSSDCETFVLGPSHSLGLDPSAPAWERTILKRRFIHSTDTPSLLILFAIKVMTQWWLEGWSSPTLPHMHNKARNASDLLWMSAAVRRGRGQPSWVPSSTYPPPCPGPLPPVPSPLRTR